jgi:hypothetical protein
MTANRTVQTRKRRKAKKSYTLSPESVAFLETLRKKRRAASTSFILEEIIQTVRLAQRKKALDTSVANYYSSLTPAESDELTAWGEFAVSEFSDLKQAR